MMKPIFHCLVPAVLVMTFIAVAAINPILTASDTAKSLSSKGMITSGQPAPDFTLPNQDGKPTSLADFRGKWVVLYFYPKDFTGGCTIEAHNFQRDLAQYDAANAVILGVSVDEIDSHQSFCTKEGLNFKLLSDTCAVVSGRYYSIRNLLVKKISARNTFIIDPQGVVAKTFVDVKPPDHSAEVLAALVELKK